MSSNGDMRLMHLRRWVVRLGLAGAGVGLVLAAQTARAQGSCTFTDENGKTVTWPNCQPPAGTNAPAANGAGTGTTQGSGTAPAPAAGASPAKSFPYPGETPPPAAPNAPPAAPASGTGVPAGQSAAGTPAANPNAPAANRFPYPGDDASGGGAPGGAAKPSGANGDGLKDAGSSGSSSSSSSDSDNSDAGPLGGDTDPAAKAAEARRAARHKKGIDFHQTPDQREVEDLKVASFYQNDGDFRGAYERATDAVSLAADDADAHLALADAARRLGKLDEAETNYKKCLTLDPVPKTKKAAERALKEMSGG